MEEIKESLEKCLEVISCYPGKLYIDEMYLSQKQWMLKISQTSQIPQEEQKAGLLTITGRP